MKHVLIISGVDLELLDKQRIEAREFQMGERNDTKGLEGILEMLDTWSDKQYFDKENNK